MDPDGTAQESKPGEARTACGFPGSTLYHAVHCKLAHDEEV